MSKPKVQISERALLQRVNRKLAKDDKKMLRARYYRDGNNLYENSNLGRFYIIHLSRNHIADLRVDLEECAREVGALADWEELVVE